MRPLTAIAFVLVATMGSAAAAADGDCSDEIQNCSDDRYKTACSFPSVANVCRKTCGVCGGMTKGEQVCEDKYPSADCELTKQFIGCSENNMRLFCEKTCKLCGKGITLTTTSTTTTSTASVVTTPPVGGVAVLQPEVAWKDSTS